MADDKLSAALQRAVLGALCFDAEHGAVIAAQVSASHFDAALRAFAGEVLDYRRQFRKPPGAAQLDDIADKSLANSRDAAVVRELIPQLIAEASSLNAAWAAQRAQEFIRAQLIKKSVQDAIDVHERGGDAAAIVEDVEKIYRDVLKHKAETLSPGLFLSDPAGLDFLEAREDIISLGIKELDTLGVGLAPKEMLLYIGPKGEGKTWFCVHAARHALLQGKKVVHISLEMSELKCFRRYMQNWFGAARRPDKYLISQFVFDDLDRLKGWKDTYEKPKITFFDPKIRLLLKSKMKPWGARFGNLIIKAFPTNRLTVPQLEGYLDFLCDAHDFIPNVLIIDYPDLMKKGKDFRIEIGNIFEEVRGLGVQRNLAILAPTQGSRRTIGASRVRSSDAAEDIRKVNAADTVLAFSRTRAEARHNLGRLSVEHARDVEGGGSSEIMLSQSYATGQYVLASGFKTTEFWDKLREEKDSDENEGESE